MKRLDKVAELAKSYYRLFELTCNPVFFTAHSYIKRTNNLVCLQALEETKDELTL